MPARGDHAPFRGASRKRSVPRPLFLCALAVSVPSALTLACRKFFPAPFFEMPVLFPPFYIGVRSRFSPLGNI